MVLWKSFWLSSATKGPEQGHVMLIALVATEPHLLHFMSCSWYRTLSSREKQSRAGHGRAAQRRPGQCRDEMSRIEPTRTDTETSLIETLELHSNRTENSTSVLSKYGTTPNPNACGIEVILKL